MIHSDEKVRQMARSLLPSKNREAARSARTHIHRAARRESRQTLAAWMQFEDREDDLPSFAPWERPEIRMEVRWRRDGDKVNPFIRWATARTRGIRREDRLSHVRSLLPNGVIGEHALGHVKHTTAFRDPVLDAWRPRYLLRFDARRNARSMDWGEQACLLRALLMEPEGHRTFNRFLRERHNAAIAAGHRVSSGSPTHRALLGVHDVLPFLDALKRHPWGTGDRDWNARVPPAQWVRLFLQRFKEHHHCIPSVRAALETEGLMKPAIPARPRKAHTR